MFRKIVSALHRLDRFKGRAAGFDEQGGHGVDEVNVVIQARLRERVLAQGPCGRPALHAGRPDECLTLRSGHRANGPAPCFLVREEKDKLRQHGQRDQAAAHSLPFHFSIFLGADFYINLSEHEGALRYELRYERREEYGTQVEVYFFTAHYEVAVAMRPSSARKCAEASTLEGLVRSRPTGTSSTASIRSFPSMTN